MISAKKKKFTALAIVSELYFVSHCSLSISVGHIARWRKTLLALEGAAFLAVLQRGDPEVPHLFPVSHLHFLLEERTPERGHRRWPDQVHSLLRPPLSPLWSSGGTGPDQRGDCELRDSLSWALCWLSRELDTRVLFGCPATLMVTGKSPHLFARCPEDKQSQLRQRTGVLGGHAANEPTLLKCKPLPSFC